MDKAKYLVLDIEKGEYDFKCDHPTIVRWGEKNLDNIPVHIVKEGKPLDLEGCSDVYFLAERPDGRKIMTQCIITDDAKGYVEIVVPNELCGVPGKMHLAYLSIHNRNDGSITTTERMDVICEEAVNFFSEEENLPYIEGLIKQPITVEQIDDILKGIIYEGKDDYVLTIKGLEYLLNELKKLIVQAY